jgi:hypothetical protein
MEREILSDPLTVFWLTVILGGTLMLIEFFTRPKL